MTSGRQHRQGITVKNGAVPGIETPSREPTSYEMPAMKIPMPTINVSFSPSNLLSMPIITPVPHTKHNVLGSRHYHLFVKKKT